MALWPLLISLNLRVSICLKETHCSSTFFYLSSSPLFFFDCNGPWPRRVWDLKLFLAGPFDIAPEVFLLRIVVQVILYFSTFPHYKMSFPTRSCRAGADLHITSVELVRRSPISPCFPIRFLPRYGPAFNIFWPTLALFFFMFVFLFPFSFLGHPRK